MLAVDGCDFLKAPAARVGLAAWLLVSSVGLAACEKAVESQRSNPASSPVALSATKSPPSRTTPDLAAKSVLASADVLEALKEQEAYTPKDQFSAPFDSSALVGKLVSLHLGPFAPDRPSPAGSPTWSYDIPSQTLTVTFDQAGLLASLGPGDGSASDLRTNRSVELARDDVPLGTYDATNAMGAHIQVSRSKVDKFGVVEFHPYTNHPLGAFLTWKIKAPPEQARTIAPHVTVDVDAEVVAASGTVTKCDTSTSSPTFSSPQETTIQSCFLSVKVKKIALGGLPEGVTAKVQRDD